MSLVFFCNAYVGSIALDLKINVYSYYFVQILELKHAVQVRPHQDNIYS